MGLRRAGSLRGDRFCIPAFYYGIITNLSQACDGYDAVEAGAGYRPRIRATNKRILVVGEVEGGDGVGREGASRDLFLKNKQLYTILYNSKHFLGKISHPWQPVGE
jgi:hypothetical protein